MAFDVPVNLCVIWDNRYFDAATLTPSSEVATLPARNLQDPQRTRPWRAEGITGEYLEVDLTAAQICNCLVLIDHNLTPAGKFTLQASNAADYSTLLLDQEYDAWLPVYGTDEFGFGEHGFWGCFLEEERQFYVPQPIRAVYFRQPLGTAEIKARYWRLLFTDPDNPDGYIQIGRIFLCRYDEYSCQFEFGMAMPGQDESVINTSPGGQKFSDYRPYKRGRLLPWTYFPKEDFWWKFNFFQEKVGLSRPFVVDAFPAGLPSQRFYNLLYCRLNAPPEPEAAAPGLFKVQMEVIEET